MDEYQHMERFSMDNDYDDGRWIGDEFYYSQRKTKRRQTREDALYGVFGESDSDDDDSSRRKRRDLIKKGDLTKPVNFISTGTFKPSEEVDKDEGEEPSSDPGRPGLGSGGSTGLGYAASSTQETEDESSLSLSAFGKRIQEAAERREKEKQEKKLKEKSASKSKGFSSGVGEMAEFEKHTRGIGMKLLEKMGYKGGGLGKNAQGIAIPIEAKLRPKNMGMGFNDYKETLSSAPLPVQLPGVDETDVKMKDSKPKEKLWQKKNKGRKKTYRTADDLLIEKGEQGFEPVQTIIDMTGPKVRVLTNFDQINTQQTDVEDDSPMPELRYNIGLIVSRVEADIQRYDKKLRQEKETAVSLDKVRVRLKQDVERQRELISTLEYMSKEIENLQQQVMMGTINLDVIADTFKFLRKEYTEEYKLHNLSCIALSFGLPLIVELFQGWEPLLQPHHGTDVLLQWKGLLEGDDPMDFSIFPDANSYGTSLNELPFAQLIMTVVFPALRFAATNVWEPRDPEPMIKFLEIWQNLLPKSVLNTILEHVVLPKLAVAVDCWDPRQETVAIHEWLHPWLPLLGQRMEPLYHPIRYKLGDALRAWHPGDRSAYMLLSPWQTVFDPGSWEQLLVRSIMPKLMGALQELVINPQSQQLQPFRWVMEWATAVPIHHMATMLEAIFFPKWHQVLYHWLCSTPKFEEVTEWYLGWKKELTPELLANEKIRKQLQIALDMMDQAVEGMPVVQPGARENVSYLRVTEKRQFETQHQAYPQQRYGANTSESGMAIPEMSLKEVVETFAEQNDILFLPKVGRMHEGLQVYGFGSISICMDNAHQRLYAQTGDRWIPVSLEQLLEMHSAQSKRWK